MKKAVSTVVLAAAAAVASADISFSTINPAPGSEPGHRRIFENIYGGTWGSFMLSTRDFSNGTITAMRYADGGASMAQDLGLGALVADDSHWSGGETIVTARAKHAGDRSTFGWFNDAAEDPAFRPIIATGTLNAPVTLNLSSAFRWGLQDHTTGSMFSSDPASNGMRAGIPADHLVTYRIYGAESNKAVWLLFWEDRAAHQNSDWDFNDAVIEITTERVIPAPGAMALASAAGFLGLRRRR